MKVRTGHVHGQYHYEQLPPRLTDSLILLTLHRAGVSIYPHPDAGGHSLQAENFKYFWALAYRDPTSGVQVGHFYILLSNVSLSHLINVLLRP